MPLWHQAENSVKCPMQKKPPSVSPQLCPELRFLIACCQTDPSDDDKKFINSTIQHSAFSIQHSLALANAHGVLPLVYKTLQALYADTSAMKMKEGGKTIIEDNSPHSSQSPIQYLLSELKTAYMSIVQRNMLMTGELIRIMELLGENGIKALAFKGPTLARLAYGDITLRQFGDLDVLTRKEDVYKIDTLLQAHGYERVLTLTPVQEKIWIKYAHDMGLIHPQKNTYFEMHWSLLDEDYPMQVDLEGFWKETQSIKINGHSILTFSNENLLYYLCIHGSKHLWERIEWIKDLDLMVRNTAVDWDALRAKGEGSGFEEMVYLGLALSASLFATPLPPTVKEKIAKQRNLEAVTAFVFDSWQIPRSTFAKTVAMLRLFPGFKARLLYLHKVILKPSLNEYWFVDLPKALYWVYYLVRPYLLLKKYVLKRQSP